MVSLDLLGDYYKCVYIHLFLRPLLVYAIAAFCFMSPPVNLEFLSYAAE